MQEFGTNLTNFQPFHGARYQLQGKGRKASASSDQGFILFKSVKLSYGKQPFLSEMRFGSLDKMQLQNLKTFWVFSSISC